MQIKTIKARMAAMATGGLMLCVASSAHAGLLGATVNMSAYFPDSATSFADPGNAVVSGAVEYPAGSYSSYNPDWAIDISDTQLVITDTQSVHSQSFLPSSFNGWILKVISGPSILSASVDSSSDFSPAISVVGGDLLLNYQSVQTSLPGMSSVINFTTASAVPEPGTLALFGLGLAGLGFARRKKKVA